MRQPRDQTLLGHAKAMRNAPTEAERKLWYALRSRRLLGAKFSRQIAVGPFIADFACREARLIVELDGGGHDIAYDAARDAKLGALGYRVLRFTNANFSENPSGVLEAIALALGAECPPPGPAQGRRLSAPLPAGEGEQA